MFRPSGHTSKTRRRGEDHQPAHLLAVELLQVPGQRAAAELRLPITVPNPAHAQFISRRSPLTPSRKRARCRPSAPELMGFPGRGVAACAARSRDREVLPLHRPACIAAGCRSKVSVDFHQDGDEATLRFHLKGSCVKTKVLLRRRPGDSRNTSTRPGIESGPLFRPRLAPHSEALNARAVTERTMNRLLMATSKRLPGAMHEVELGPKTCLAGEDLVQLFSPERAVLSAQRDAMSLFKKWHPQNSAGGGRAPQQVLPPCTPHTLYAIEEVSNPWRLSQAPRRSERKRSREYPWNADLTVFNKFRFARSTLSRIHPHRRSRKAAHPWKTPWT